MKRRKPKLREWMISRTIAEDVDVRFWWNAKKIEFNAAFAKVHQWSQQFKHDPDDPGLSTVVASIEAVNWTALAAFEVTYAGDGEVVYYEWP